MHFYDSKLMNGETMSSKSALFHETEGLGPYVFYDIIDGQELRGKSSGALSLYNEHEAEAAVELLQFFRRRYSFISQGKSILLLFLATYLSLLVESCFLNNLIWIPFVGTHLSLLVEELAS